MSEIPLVATTEYDGMYEPASYAAGMEMGELKGLLSSGQVSIVAQTVRAENLRQADILAMAYGFTLRCYEARGGLIEVEIRRSDPEGVL